MAENSGISTALARRLKQIGSADRNSTALGNGVNAQSNNDGTSSFITTPPAPITKPFLPGGIGWVRNDSGSDIVRFGILSVNSDAIVVSPSSDIGQFSANPTFVGYSPIAPGTYGRGFGKFCIAYEPIASGAIGRAYFFGFCPVKINFINSGDRWADAISGDLTQLQSDSSAGGVEILWTEGGTGTKWALVKFTGGFLPAVGTYCDTNNYPAGCGTNVPDIVYVASRAQKILFDLNWFTVTNPADSGAACNAGNTALVQGNGFNIRLIDDYTTTFVDYCGARNLVLENAINPFSNAHLDQAQDDIASLKLDSYPVTNRVATIDDPGMCLCNPDSGKKYTTERLRQAIVIPQCKFMYSVTVTKDGGYPGSMHYDTDCSFTYTIKNCAGKTLGTGLTPAVPRFPACKYNQPSDNSPGIAYYDGAGAIHLYSVAEEIPTTTVVTNITDFKVDDPTKPYQIKPQAQLVLDADDKSDWTTIYTGEDCAS